MIPEEEIERDWIKLKEILHLRSGNSRTFILSSFVRGEMVKRCFIAFDSYHLLLQLKDAIDSIVIEEKRNIERKEMVKQVALILSVKELEDIIIEKKRTNFYMNG